MDAVTQRAQPRPFTHTYLLDTTSFAIIYSTDTHAFTELYEAYIRITMFKTIFQHKPLDLSRPDAFRILKLLPGRFDDSLAGRLENHHVHEEGLAYEAVSYVWGQWSSTDLISLDDAGTHIPITSSLATLLRNIRSPETNRIVWVDQLCINQQDNDEKGRQVAMMGRIYSRASRVLVWLGEASTESPLAMQFLDDLINGQISKPWRRFHLPSLKVGLGYVLGSEWFSRMWVVQESGLSSEIALLCGNDSVGWLSHTDNDIEYIIRRLEFAACHPDLLGEISLKPLIDILQRQFKVRLQHRYEWYSQLRFLDLMYEYRDRKCGDLRDRLYGIYGLADGGGIHVPFHPDYSLSIEETFDRLENWLFPDTELTQLEDLPPEPDWHGEGL